MFAGAALAAGGLLGLLFGVPRSMVLQQQPVEAQLPISGIAANTNLEQISDWLTKIIVGVSLTQLFTIKRNALHLFNAMAPSLGGGSQASAFAGAEVVYFAILGFGLSWLYARLRLGVMMSNTDTLLRFAQWADKAGEPVIAQQARAALGAAVIAATTTTTRTAQESTAQGSVSLVDLVGRYAQLRATLAPSATRTAQLEDVIRQARHLAQAQQLTMQDTRGMFQTGDEGSRAIALGVMQGHISSADLESVLDAIRKPKSAFEQYQALVVANLLTSTLNERDRGLLLTALQDIQRSLAASTSRRGLVESILSRLAQLA